MSATRKGKPKNSSSNEAFMTKLLKSGGSPGPGGDVRVRDVGPLRKSISAYLKDKMKEENYFEKLNRLPSKRHVFANVWESSLDPRRGGACETVDTGTWTIDWRKWPPDLPRMGAGVKIPVDFTLSTGLKVVEATALSSGNKQFYSGLKGMFNPWQTSSIEVTPPALLFLNSRAGQFYSVKVRLRNISSIPRRVKLIPPKNTCFTVGWAATHKHAHVNPGISIPIHVHYRPKSNESTNDVLFIAVEGDGGLTVPLVAAIEPPPILHFDEWDCGCSVLDYPRYKEFTIKNVGSEGKFYLLTEYEFLSQAVTYPKQRSKLPARFSKAASSSQEEEVEEEGESKTEVVEVEEAGMKVVTISTPSPPRRDPVFDVNVCAGPFTLNTAFFKLLRNQKLTVAIDYTPSSVGPHVEKLAVMCDNGEMRWVAVRGEGIDMYGGSPETGFVQLLYDGDIWPAPPVDLPFDEKCYYALDLGDVLAGNVGEGKFKATNRSCVPLYYFWSVRPLLTEFMNASGITFHSTSISPEEKPRSSTVGSHGKPTFQKFMEGTLVPQDLIQLDQHRHYLPPPQEDGLVKTEHHHHHHHHAHHHCHPRHHHHQQHSRPETTETSKVEVADVTISPAQGVIRDREIAEFTVNAPSPQSNGYHACVLSLYVEQLDDRLSDKLREFLKELETNGLNNVPVHSYFLRVAGQGQDACLDGQMLSPRLSEGELGEEEKSVTEDDEEEEEEEGDEEQETEAQSPKEEEEEEEGILKGEDEDDEEEVDFIMRPRKSSTVEGPDGQSPRKSCAQEEPIDYEGLARKWSGSGTRPLNNIKPVLEIEIWLRSMPLDIVLTPPFIVAQGPGNSRIEREISVLNNSQWGLELTLDLLHTSVGTICCQPYNLKVPPFESASVNAVICLKNCGKIFEALRGSMRIESTISEVPFSLPCSITSTGPYVILLTPLIHFGFVRKGGEAMKTIAIKNIGDRPAQWTACMNTEPLEDDEGNNLTPNNDTVVSMKLLRVWPMWGTLEPGETVGVNVYLSAEVTGDLVSSVAIAVKDISDSELYASICAFIEEPFVYLEEDEAILCKETLIKNKVEDAMAVLVNPCGFPIAFAWHPCLLGTQGDLFCVAFSPTAGIIAANGTMDVSLTFTPRTEGEVGGALTHVYGICLVDGMTEPLILKIFIKD